MTGSRVKNSMFGFALLVMMATLQVLLLTTNFLATAIAFFGSLVVALLGLMFVRSSVQPDEAAVAEQPWSARRQIATIVVFALSLGAATLRGLGVSEAIWIPLALAAATIVVAGLLYDRHRT